MKRPADNPFASHRIEALPFEPQGTTWDELLQRLEMLRYRCCILGREGSGKTTLLERLVPELEGRGFRPVLHLHHGWRPTVPWSILPRLSRTDVVLFDGADLIGAATWQALRLASWRAGGLIVTSHEIERLPVLLRCTTDAALLARLLERLVPGGDPVRRRALAEELLARHEGNVRESLREAYDRCAEEEGI